MYIKGIVSENICKTLYQVLILIQFDYVFYVIDLKIIVTFQINSSAVNETRHWCQPAQRNHCQGHLRPAVVAAQTLQTKSCVPGEDHKGKYWRASAANKCLKSKKYIELCV